MFAIADRLMGGSRIMLSAQMVKPEWLESQEAKKENKG